MLLLDLTVQISDLCRYTEVKMRQMCLKPRETFGDVDYRLHKKAQVDQA